MHPRLGKVVRHEEEKFDLGTAAHAMLLEGDEAIAVIDPQDHIGPRGGVPKGWTNDSIRTSSSVTPNGAASCGRAA